ncbi:MAG TPA: SDR family NAD(P)-dependent oxidoreductase [Acidimicrobiia bacterium]|nr:SDR family NAD(P)-dependent oxidoreductase [Acidimicrobiia bacterium]
MTLVIVGTGPGLGSALARRFAREGWPVALVALRQDVIDAGLAELEEFGVPTHGVRADVTDRDLVDQAFASITDALGVPDVVVYNASIYQAETALELSPEGLRLAFDVHVVGALNTAQSAIGTMQGTDHGVLVFTVNSLARSPEAMSAALSIGKGAQLNLALSLERELEGTPIHVGVVTICGPIKAGTAYDPDRLADVYWELATQEPSRFERDRLVQASD